MRNPVNKVKKAIYARAYNIAHREEITAYKKAYYAAHKEEIDVYQKAYRANPDRRDARKEYFKAYAVAHHEHRAATGKAYRSVNKEKVLAHKRDYYLANKKKINEQRKARLPFQRKKIREYRIKKAYGISTVEFNAILCKQGGRCAICARDGWVGQGPHVDHDHITGKVRGILCGKFNTAIGMIGDNPKIARTLADYLKGAELNGRPSLGD